jgi:putative transposase
MGRAVRRDIEGAWHHVMNRGADHARIFFTKGDGEAFERLLAEGSERWGVEVHAYCLMPNHFHLLLHCPNAGLSRYMQRVATKYSLRINARVGGDGPLFRSRFRSILIDCPRYLAQAGRYIHRNPEDLSPPVDLVTYRWSSLRFYAGLATPPSWLHTSTLPLMCAGRYLDFVQDDVAA